MKTYRRKRRIIIIRRRRRRRKRRRTRRTTRNINKKREGGGGGRRTKRRNQVFMCINFLRGGVARARTRDPVTLSRRPKREHRIFWVPQLSGADSCIAAEPRSAKGRVFFCIQKEVAREYRARQLFFGDRGLVLQTSFLTIDDWWLEKLEW